MDSTAWVREAMMGLAHAEKEAVVHAFLELTKKRIQLFKAGRGNKVFKNRGDKYMSTSPVYHLLQLATVSRASCSSQADIARLVESRVVPVSLPVGMTLEIFENGGDFARFLENHPVLNFPGLGTVENPLWGHKIFTCQGEGRGNDGCAAEQAKFIEGRLASGAKMIGVCVDKDLCDFEKLRQWALLVRAATNTFGLSRRFVCDVGSRDLYERIPEMSAALWNAITDTWFVEGLSDDTRKALRWVTPDQVVLQWTVQEAGEAHLSKGDGTGAIFARDDAMFMEVSEVFDRKKRRRLAKREDPEKVLEKDQEIAVTLSIGEHGNNGATCSFMHTSGDFLFNHWQLPAGASERLRAAMACARGGWGAVAHAIKNKKVLVTRDIIIALVLHFRNAPFIWIGEDANSYIMKS